MLHVTIPANMNGLIIFILVGGKKNSNHVNFTKPLERNGPTFHRPQSSNWSTIMQGDALQ